MLANTLLITLLLLWAGMILGISFLESWVKFRAPSVTKPIALDVGRTVFTAFHRVQLAWLVAVLAVSVWVGLDQWLWMGVILVGVGLLIQTFILLPKLSKRATLVIEGKPLPRSSVHKIFALLECIKLVTLIGCSVILMFAYVPLVLFE